MADLSQYSDADLMRAAGMNQLMPGLIRTESNGNPNAMSSAGASGIAQIMPETAHNPGYGVKPLQNWDGIDPRTAPVDEQIRFANDYLNAMTAHNGGDNVQGLMAYNGGPGTVNRWKHGNGSLPQETAQYPGKVIGASQNPDLSSMSDSDLMKAAGMDHPQKSTSAKQQNPGIFDTVMDQGLQGATFGYGDEAQSALAAMALSAMNGKPFADNYNNALNLSRNKLNSEQQANPGTAMMSQIGGSLLTGLAGGETAAGKAIGDWVGSGGLGSRIAKGGLAGAASGGLYGSGTATDGNRLEGAKEGAEAGMALGAAIPAVTGALGAVKSAIFPSVADETKPLAKMAMEDYNIPLSRSQIGDSKAAKTLASTVDEIPFSGSSGFLSKQQTAFNKAIANTIGENAEKVTPDVIDSAYKNIGAKFDTVLKGRDIKISQNALDNLADIAQDASSYITKDHSDVVDNAIKKIINQIGPSDTIAGEKLGSIRSQITSALRSTRNDASPYLSRIRDAIVDMSTEGAPQQLKDTLSEALSQYKNLKTIEPLAAKATNGNISPALLQSRVIQSFRDYARGGGGDLGNLARIGQAFLKETIPNSGTARRLASYGALFEVPSYIMGGPAALMGGAAKAVGGLAAANVFNRVNTYEPLVKSAINSAPMMLPNTAGTIPGSIAAQLQNLTRLPRP